MGNREDCLKPFIKSPGVATNNNTRLASGVVRRKNKLEGVVQKKNCPYYIDYLWLVKETDTLCRFTLTQGLGSLNLYQESKPIIMAGSRTHIDTHSLRNRIILDALPDLLIRIDTDGMILDYEETILEQAFRFINPNAQKSCGCGRSFQV